MKTLLTTLIHGSLGLGLLAVPALAQDKSWTISADKVYTAAGDAIDGGVVTVADGKISTVTPGSADGDDVLECYAVTPGLIDLSARVSTGSYSVEQSTETPVAMNVADTLDLFDYRWTRELKSGVTTVLANPADKAVLGGYGVALKTGGEPTLEARLLKDETAVRASMGREPSSGPATFYYRRPTTRMGVEWVFRKSFYDTLAARQDESLRTPETQVLERVLQGELPLTVQAWMTQDIRTAIYMKEEFQIPRMVIDSAAEAWKEPALLVRSGAEVVLPPFSTQGNSGEGSFFAWDTAKVLHENGVTFALSGHGARNPESRLNLQPGYAMRGGLPFDAALAAVTINPARMIGVDDRVGTVEVGKDADLVLWSGEPFQPTSRVIGVLLNGELVLDPRPDAE